MHCSGVVVTLFLDSTPSRTHVFKARISAVHSCRGRLGHAVSYPLDARGSPGDLTWRLPAIQDWLHLAALLVLCL